MSPSITGNSKEKLKISCSPLTRPEKFGSSLRQQICPSLVLRFKAHFTWSYLIIWPLEMHRLLFLEITLYPIISDNLAIRNTLFTFSSKHTISDHIWLSRHEKCTFYFFFKANFNWSLLSIWILMSPRKLLPKFEFIFTALKKVVPIKFKILLLMVKWK